MHRRDQSQRRAVFGGERYVTDMRREEQSIHLICRECRAVPRDRAHARTVPGRLRDWPAIVLRSLVLSAAVRRRCAGRELRPLLHGGREFLDELADCTHLLRVSPPAPGLRERWLDRLTLRAARRLGVTDFARR